MASRADASIATYSAGRGSRPPQASLEIGLVPDLVVIDHITIAGGKFTTKGGEIGSSERGGAVWRVYTSNYFAKSLRPPR